MLDREIELIHLVASSPTNQIAAFPEYVEVADEIAIEVGEVADQATAESEVSILREIDALFSVWSGPDHLEVWTIEALATHEVWRHARELARAWLAANGITPRAPRLFWLTFVGPPGA